VAGCLAGHFLEKPFYMNNLDGLFGSDIGEKKRVDILMKPSNLPSRFDKIRFVYDHVCHDFLSTNGAQAISDEFYELLNNDSDAYESINVHIVNLYLKNQKAEFFAVRKEEFSKKSGVFEV
jgi:hypothetical protein